MTTYSVYTDMKLVLEFKAEDKTRATNFFNRLDILTLHNSCWLEVNGSIIARK